MVCLVRVIVIRVGKYQDVIDKGYDVEKYGFVVEKELREEGEVLPEEFVVCAVNFPNGIASVVIDLRPWGCRSVRAEFRMACVGAYIACIPKAPPADVERVCVFADEAFWVDGLVPGLETQIAKNDMLDIAGQ